MTEQQTRIVDLVEYLVSSLVDTPERVVIEYELDGDRLLINISVDEGEVGKVIGRNGRTIKSIRTLARAAANTSDLIVEVDVEG